MLTHPLALGTVANMQVLNPFDEEAVMAACGEVVPIILREAMDAGFDSYRRSRALDPEAQLDYTPTTRANMLVNRMYRRMSELVDAADPEGLHLRTRQTDNSAAVELFVGAEIYVKPKRIRDRLLPPVSSDDPEFADLVDVELIEQGLPKNIPTRRVLAQRTPGAYTGPQMILDGIPPVQVPDDGSERICLVAGFDMDVVEERLERHRIGLYGHHKAYWVRPLPALTLRAVALHSAPLAEQVRLFRQARSA